MHLPIKFRIHQSWSIQKSMMMQRMCRNPRLPILRFCLSRDAEYCWSARMFFWRNIWLETKGFDSDRLKELALKFSTKESRKVTFMFIPIDIKLSPLHREKNLMSMFTPMLYVGIILERPPISYSVSLISKLGKILLISEENNLWYRAIDVLVLYSTNDSSSIIIIIDVRHLVFPLD